MLQPFPTASCFPAVVSTWRNTISASCGVSQPTHRTFQSSSCCSRFFWITCIDTKRLMPSDTTVFLPKEPVVRHNFLLNRWKQWLTKSFTHIITCQDIIGFLNSAGHTCRNSNFVSHRGIRFKMKTWNGRTIGGRSESSMYCLALPLCSINDPVPHFLHSFLEIKLHQNNAPSSLTLPMYPRRCLRLFQHTFGTHPLILYQQATKGFLS